MRWYTKQSRIRTGNEHYSITNSYEVHSEEELHNELCNLFESAHQNGVPIGTISTLVCQHEHIPDTEIMLTGLAKR